MGLSFSKVEARRATEADVIALPAGLRRDPAATSPDEAHVHDDALVWCCERKIEPAPPH